MATRSRRTSGAAGRSRGNGRVKLDLAKIKREAAGLQLPQQGPAEDVMHALRAQLRTRKRALTKKLMPLIREGLDPKKAAPILAAYDRDRRQLHKWSQVASGRVVSAAARNARNQSAAATKLRQLLVGQPHFTPITIELSPFLIFTTPSKHNALRNDSREPGNAFASIYSSREVPDYPVNTQHIVGLRFHYMWRNDSAYYAGVNLSCAPRLTGRCSASANSGFLEGGTVSLDGTANLIPIIWNVPSQYGGAHTYPPYQANSTNRFLHLAADSGGFWSTSDSDVRQFAGAIDLRYDGFLIPPDQLAVFVVDFHFAALLIDGDIEIDFASNANYSIAIPSLNLELLTGPTITGGPFGSVVGVSARPD